jgi:hypothetical protein
MIAKTSSGLIRISSQQAESTHRLDAMDSISFVSARILGVLEMASLLAEVHRRIRRVSMLGFGVPMVKRDAIVNSLSPMEGDH